MKVITYNNLSAIEKEQFYAFLKSTQLESKPASINMWHDNWIDKTNTLPFILENTNRFDGINGTYHILFNDSTIVACSGVYISDFSNNVALAGVRTWVSKDYRHNSIIREYLLPVQKEWCREKTVKIIALTFNDYNKNLIQVFKKRRLGETKERIKTRQPSHLFYNNFNEVNIPVVVQYTKQWLVYELLDLDFIFDWKSIEYKN
jgi:hypothetical protein